MSFFSALVKGIGAFVFGMNFIAILMKVNGSAASGNIAWDFVSAFVKLELWIVSIAIIIAVCFFVFKHLENTEHEEKFQQNESIKIATNTAKQYQENIQSHMAKAAAAKELNIESLQVKHQKATAPPRPAPEQLSKEEIRKRVLRELTGRNDL
ncbi:MAG: hypothetical protein KA116_11410 [Proteobacteria bacterium]|nr:hypothetical protein [Pseudomonadota bacterium]